MNSQQFGRDPQGRSGEMTSTGGGRTTGSAAKEGVSKLSDAAQQATTKIKQSASEATSNVTHQVKDLLNAQVGSGAEMVGHFANSAKRAAEDLDRNAPQLAGLVRGMADRIEGFADDMRDQSVDQLMRTASDFTRRQPALVFGLAALGGFFIFRTLKAAGDTTPNYPGASSYPGTGGRQQGASQYHGV